ncbi:MAG: hypothetical protein NZT92_13320 [Abditibacteriales bacterium]|nr:hypothetical protein [Abditibacteriales bacterium]MDW8366941.1 hypothetical protein [Abditibacteriales bacterium]
MYPVKVAPDKVTRDPVAGLSVSRLYGAAGLLALTPDVMAGRAKQLPAGETVAAEGMASLRSP